MAGKHTWNIDAAHSGIHFSIRHLVIAKVRGRFTKFSGVIELDEEDLTKSRLSVEIDVASIDTSEAQRDTHLRSPEFFAVEKFPKATFTSKSITKSGAAYDVTGDFTLHGITKEITLKSTLEGKEKDLRGGERVVFAAKTSLSREDFGLTWSKLLESGGLALGMHVELEIDVQGIKEKSA